MRVDPGSYTSVVINILVWAPLGGVFFLPSSRKRARTSSSNIIPGSKGNRRSAIRIGFRRGVRSHVSAADINHVICQSMTRVLVSGCIRLAVLIIGIH